MSIELIGLCCITALLAEAAATDRVTVQSMVELAQAEQLDTVSLDRPIHFTAPDTTDAVAQPETYLVMSEGRDRIKLVSQKNKHAVVVQALITGHTEDIAEPIALFVQDDDKFPHIVLLLPGGTGLEAIGSYDIVRTRGVLRSSLTSTQIRSQLKRKIAEVQAK